MSAYQKPPTKRQLPNAISMWTASRYSCSIEQENPFGFWNSSEWSQQRQDFIPPSTHSPSPLTCKRLVAKFWQPITRWSSLADQCVFVLGGPVQDLSNFQMAPIPFLSDLTSSTHSPHNLPVGHVKRDIRVLGGCNVGCFVGFWLALSLYSLACYCCYTICH